MARFGGRSEAGFRHAASRAGKSADHTSPLRKVVGQDTEVIDGVRSPRLRLECGHLVRYPQTAWGGDYIPERRRCRPCATTPEPAAEGGTDG